MRTTRRRFLKLSGSAVVAGSVATSLGIAPRAVAQDGSRRMVFRLSTRNTRVCNACRSHARNKVFADFFLADANRAHPGCDCRITFHQMASSLVEQLQTLETRGAGVWDIRTVSPATSQGTRNLVPGWNLIAAPRGTLLGDLIAALDGRASALFVWEASLQTFLSYRLLAPSDGNTLRELRDDQAIWILVTDPGGAPVTLRGENGSAVPRSLALEQGWNLVPWRGPDRELASGAVSSLGSALDVLHIWDAAAQRFVTYAPRLPLLPSGPVELRRDEGIWLLVRRAVEWEQGIA